MLFDEKNENHDSLGVLGERNRSIVYAVFDRFRSINAQLFAAFILFIAYANAVVMYTVNQGWATRGPVFRT